MLVLYRRIGQSFFLQDPLRDYDTKIIVLQATTNGEVRIGVDASEDIKIITEEKLLIKTDEIENEN